MNKLLLTLSSALPMLVLAASDQTITSPDPKIGKLRFEVMEISVDKTQVAHEIAALDFAHARPADYKPDGASQIYRVVSESNEQFLRIGETRRQGKNCGVQPAKPIAVEGGSTYELSFSGRIPAVGGGFAIYVVALNERGENVSPNSAPPEGWIYSPYSKAFYYTESPTAINQWQDFVRKFTVPDGVKAIDPIVTAYRGDYVDCRLLKVKSLVVKKCVIANFTRRESRANGVRLTDDHLGLQIDATCELDNAGATIVRAKVADVAHPARPRALKVRLAMDRDLRGWTYHHHWREDKPIVDEVTRYSYGVSVSGHSVGMYPFSAVSKDGKGFLFGTEFDGHVYENREVSGNGIVSTAVLGLLELPGREASSELSWLAKPFEGKWGFRSAAKAYYESQDYKLPRLPKDVVEGCWSWPIFPSKLPPHPEDFGLVFWEAGSVPSGEIEKAKELGIRVYPYSEAAGMRHSVGTERDKLPTVEERLAIIKSWAAEKNSKAGWFGAPRNIAAQACLNSMPVTPDGKNPFILDHWADWTQWWMTNPDPRIAAKPNRFTLCWEYGGYGKLYQKADGFYIDSLGVACDFSNVRPEHLAVMTEPLLYDVETAMPCAIGLQHNHAFIRYIGSIIHPLNKHIFGNAFGFSYRLFATDVDILAREVGSFGHRKADELRSRRTMGDGENAASCIRRFYCQHRPVLSLLSEGNYEQPLQAISAEGMRNYINEQLFYGFYPGVNVIGGEDKPGYNNFKRYFADPKLYERDRAEFKRSIPMIRALNKAVWAPETKARSDKPATVLVERYGRYITIRNADDATAESLITFDDSVAAKMSAFKAVWSGHDRELANLIIANGKNAWKVTLEPWETIVGKVE